MDDLSPSNLKSILHSKRSNIYFLEYCRVMQKDDIKKILDKLTLCLKIHEEKVV